METFTCHLNKVEANDLDKIGEFLTNTGVIEKNTRYSITQYALRNLRVGVRASIKRTVEDLELKSPKKV